MVVGYIYVEIFPIKTISSMLHLEVIECFLKERKIFLINGCLFFSSSIKH